jgi:hypothetical protein
MVGGDDVGAGTRAGSQEALLWIALGLHTEESSAHALMDAGAAAVPCLESAEEVWAGLLQPFSHRGEVNGSITIRLDGRSRSTNKADNGAPSW